MKPKQMKEGCWWKGKFIEAYAGCQPNVSEGFNRGGLPGLSRTLKADTEAHAAGVCVEYYTQIDMAKVYTVKNITLVGKTIPDGASGGTGYDEYAHLLVEYYNSESQKATVGYYYQNVNLVFQQLYDELFGCENPEHAYELLYGAIKGFVPAADFNALPDKYKSPKRENAAPRKYYRIRKLTPTECLRLMGVSDKDIEKMKAYPFHMLIDHPSYSKEEIMAGMTEDEKRRLMKDKISDSQLYKLAGNSIVVDVLEAIFRNLDFQEKPLRVFEAFAGYGSQSMALRNIGVEHEVVGISEIDKYAIMGYNATHPETKNYGDICNIDWQQVPDFDFFTYSFPCGLAGTLVKMQVGYKRIEDVKVGDYVLTHNNRYGEVIRTMSRISEKFYEIKAIGCHLFLTENHPLWVLRDGVEQWVKVGDLKKTDRISYCIPQKEVDVHISDETLWMLGRYVADGWVNPRLYNSVEFAIGFDKEDEFIRHIPEGWNMRKFKKSCWEYRIADAAFQELCLAFGNGSQNKKLPEWIINLPKDRLAIFLDGYFAGDGHIRYRSGTKVQMFSTVSKELFCGIQMCLLKLYGKVCSLVIRTDKRKETFNDSYNGQIAFTDSPFHTIVGFRCFVPIRSIVEVNEPAQVYNLEVLGDNSYTCDNVNTHNCTDISNAGHQAGFEEGSGTRSSLLWECRKAIVAKKPKYLLMENVKAITSKKFLPGLLRWQEFLSEQGYTNFVKVLNAKDYGVPQNRERCFIVSILGDAWYDFPEPRPLELKLKDILEDKVDEKYYLDQDRVNTFIEGLSDEKRAALEEGRTD